jgi:hypothetical protein
VVCLPRVVGFVAFMTDVAVCCVCFDDWCKPAIVGAVKSALTLYPYRISVALFFSRLRAPVTVVVEAEFPA